MGQWSKLWLPSSMARSALRSTESVGELLLRQGGGACWPRNWTFWAHWPVFGSSCIAMGNKPDLSSADRAFLRFQKSGNPQDLGEVFDVTASELLRAAGHLARDAATADDLVQATFLVAITDAASYQPEAPVLSWLFGILTNQARADRRATGRVLVAERLQRGAPEDPVDALHTKELSDAVAAAIVKLPEPFQPVIKLHLRHGLSAQDIAVNLGRPAGTVRTQLVRGMDKLRQALPASLIAGSVVLTTPVYGLAAMREAVLAKAAAAKASAMSLAVGKLTLWTAAGTLSAAALAVSLFAPEVELTNFDELSPQATASVVAQKGSVDSPATATVALQADPFSPSSRLLMTFSNPVSNAPGGAITMTDNMNSPSSLSQNLGVPALLLGAMTLLPALGQSQSVIYSHNGENGGDLFGRITRIAGDVNLDGYPDVVVGADRYDLDPDGTPLSGDELSSTGRVYVYSGVDGTTLWIRDNLTSGQMGVHVDGAGDINDVGSADIVAGAPFDSSDPDGTPGTGDEIFLSGRVFAFSGKDGTTIHTIYGETAFSLLGNSVSGAGDVNGDGTPDIVAGAQGWDEDLLGPDGTGGSSGTNTGDEKQDNGRVYMLSGKDGTTLWTMEGQQAFPLLRTSNGEFEANGEKFGTSVDGGADVNGDGILDITVGSYEWDDLSDPGRAGVDGTVGTTDDLQDHGRSYVISSASLPLTADVHELSLGVANSQTMTIDAGVINAGKNYWLFTGFAASGDIPGVTMAPGVVIPLNQPDPLTSFVIGLTQLGGGAPTFMGWKSTLDIAGKATPSLNTFGPTPAPLGVTLHHAALVYTSNGCGSGCDTFQLATNWVPMTTTP